MAKEIVIQVENRKLKLTNLDKILYPDCGVTKAELIYYYLQHATIILPYLAHWPLTLIRYPDGVAGERFYSKNKPNWTPEWMPSRAIKDSQGDVKEYLSTNDAAGLVYLANLAALELHPMQVRSEHIEYSDRFIFDLDPAEDNPDFKKVKLTAEQL